MTQQPSQPTAPDKFKRVVDRIVGLPTLPSILENMNKLISNPRTSAKDVGRLISNDPTITAKILRVVNSSFYGFSNRISTISHAVAILGFNTIRSVVLSSTIFDTFGKVRPALPGYDRREFWKHSIAVGACSKVIAGKLGQSAKLEEYFISGLMHDIGKIIIDQYLAKEFEQILESVQANDCLMLEAERQVLGGVDHADIGGMLMERWGISPGLTAVIRYHHKPDLAGQFAQEAAVVHLADIVVRAMGIGSGGDRKIPAVHPAAWETLGFGMKDLDSIIEYTDKEMENAMVFMEFIK